MIATLGLVFGLVCLLRPQLLVRRDAFSPEEYASRMRTIKICGIAATVGGLLLIATGG